MPWNRLIRSAYVFLLSATGFFLPLSVWMLSALTISLSALWLITGGPARLVSDFRKRKAVLVFLLFYLVCLAGMLTTSDIPAGINELKNKLPVVAFPLIAGFSEGLSKKELKIVLTIFITGVVISSLSGILARIIGPDMGIKDPRDLSPYISHIRLAIMSVFAIFISFHYFFISSGRRGLELLYLLAGVWLSVFLFILLSVTGIIIFLIILAGTASWLIFRIKKMLIRYLLAIVILAGSLSLGLFLLRSVKSFYTPADSYPLPLEHSTSNGHPYTHDTINRDLENSNLVWIYINEDELRQGWNRISKFRYDSLDRMGQDIKYTLIRYLTSMGLRKDSLGVSALGSEDVRNIENGIANVIYSGDRRIRAKVYEVIWQLDHYIRGGNPSGHSVTQRIEFMKTGWHIFLRNPLFGVGTGDLANEIRRQYELDDSVMESQYRLEAHNQFVTFLALFGITGFAVIIFSFLYPFILTLRNPDYLVVIFFTIAMISMIGEDTLETQTGISFFAYFYSVLILGRYAKEF